MLLKYIIKKTIYCFIFLLTVISCTKTSPLEQVLVEAGNNRGELEEVLKHFSQQKSDSLKYKAAKYLIENMRFHYSIVTEDNKYYNRIKSLTHMASVEILDSIRNELDLLTDNNIKNLIIKKDIEHIKSSYLISHIDKAFLTRKYPWNKNLNFSKFCEYVLPYRIKDEPIENWMAIYTDYSKHIADSIYEKSYSYKDFIINLYNFFNKNTLYINTHTFKIRNFPSHLIGIRYGSCEDITMLGVFIFRSLGIPVYYDFTPQWANRSLGHDWNGIEINNTYYPFILQAEEEFGTHLKNKPFEKFGKIYRNKYSIQKNSLFMQFREKCYQKNSKFLETPYIEDVTHIDKNSYTVNLKLKLKANSPIAFIAVFNNQEWVPIDWSKVKNNTVTAKKVQAGCCYLIVEYHNDTHSPLANPFIITNKGNLLQIAPNKDSLQSLILTRKYPPFAMQRYAERSIGGEFHGSNHKQFKDYEVLHTVKHSLIDMKWHTVPIVPSKRYKYFRYYSAKGGYNNIAELRFISNKDIPIHGKIIGEGEYDSKAGLKENAYDGDPLTFFGAETPDNSWVGIASKQKQYINQISYLFRNDDNNIRKGDIYELFYWNDRWISLGKQQGHCDSLYYANCPKNALFLLRNHTRGKEERIFTYENEKQVWW